MGCKPRTLGHAPRPKSTMPQLLHSSVVQPARAQPRANPLTASARSLRAGESTRVLQDATDTRIGDRAHGWAGGTSVYLTDNISRLSMVPVLGRSSTSVRYGRSLRRVDYASEQGKGRTAHLAHKGAARIATASPRACARSRPRSRARAGGAAGARCGSIEPRGRGTRAHFEDRLARPLTVLASHAS
jgi:hypothetical protein